MLNGKCQLIQGSLAQIMFEFKNKKRTELCIKVSPFF